MKNLSIFTGFALWLAIPFSWPYVYFQALRWLVFLVGGYSSFLGFKKGYTEWAIVMLVITVLFNPITPFYLSRGTWILIDFIVAVFFFINSTSEAI